MKPHLVIKLRQRHPQDEQIRDWVRFIEDKSRVTRSIHPAVDRELHRFNLRFWVTNEYAPAAVDWDEAEVRHGLDRTYRVILQDDVEIPPGLLAGLRAVPAVEAVRAIGVVSTPLPMPVLAAAQSVARSRAADLIHLAYAKAVTKGNVGVTVAVLDTGVSRDHPELQGQIRREMDFVDLRGLDTSPFIGDVLGADPDADDLVGHGTHVSGILAARGLQMEEGVACGCKLLAVRVLAAMRSGDRIVGAGIVDNINAGIKWAVDNGADVINMSLGMKHTGGGLPHEDVIRYAIAREVTVVAASGNDGTAERYYPGALPGVLAVGAVDDAGAVAPFTSFGASISVVAPGVNIYSTSLQRGYAFASGTSQASPFVAGAVALLKSSAADRGRRLGNADIRYLLKSTSDRQDRRLRSEHAGYGLVNLADAFKLLDHMLD